MKKVTYSYPKTLLHIKERLNLVAFTEYLGYKNAPFHEEWYKFLQFRFSPFKEDVYKVFRSKEKPK